MRSVTVAFAPLAVIILAVCLNLLFLGNFVDDTLAMIDETIRLAQEDSFDQADQVFRQVTDKIEGTETYLSIILVHNEIDEIHLGIAKSTEYLEAHEMPEFMAEVRNLRILIEHIRVLEEVSIRNIL